MTSLQTIVAGRGALHRRRISLFARPARDLEEGAGAVAACGGQFAHVP